MDHTENLELPYIMASQAQKHVTHNEAIRKLDGLVHLSIVSAVLTAPPTSPAVGARYIVPNGATDAWTGRDGLLAAWQDGAWAFFTPVEGWLAWSEDGNKLIIFTAGQWEDIQTGGSGTGGGGNDPDPTFNTVGVNSTADAANRLSLSSPASLFNHAGAGHQIKINKLAGGDTASLLYQTGFSGRAEMGLAGSDNFSVKVSADGTTWNDALTIDAVTGTITHQPGKRHSFQHDAAEAGITLLPENGDPSTPVNGDIWYNSALGKFRKHQDGATSDLDTGGGGSGGGSTQPGGASGQLQFNKSGAFSGAASLTYNDVTGDLTVANSISIPNTADNSTGVVKKAGAPFIHAFGANNLFFGGSSGNFSLSGTANAAFGAFTLTQITTGLQNLAFGSQALNQLTSGGRNVAIGALASNDLLTGSYNIAVGSSAMQKNTAGSRSLGFGYQALYNANASDNIAFGYRAGFNITTAANNIFIGRDAGGGITTGGGNVVIGRVNGLAPNLANTVIIATGGGTKRLEIDNGGHAAFEGTVKLKSYTVSSLPSASSVGAGAMAFVSDASGGSVPAFSDGSDWRSTIDRTIIA